MSCETNATKVGQSCAKNGINKGGAKGGFVAGATPQVGFFIPSTKKKGTRLKKGTKSLPSQAGKKKKKGQPSFFALQKKSPATSIPSKNGSEPKGKETGKAPTQFQVDISGDFTPEELQTISIQLRLGGAETARHLRMASAGLRRGIGHGDPRPLDWIEADHQNFEFLVGQLSEARRGRGYLDLSSLRKPQLLDLWEFCRFESDRAGRNIDHLNVPGGPIQGPTAQYLANNHKLESRFFTYIATQIERIVPGEELGGNIAEVRGID